MNIREAIKNMTGDQDEVYSLICKVDSIDENKRVVDVTPVNDAAKIHDCRIQAEIEKTKGIAIFPKKDSFVVVTFISKNHAFVSLTSEIDKIVVDFPEISGSIDTIKIKGTKITLNDGNNSGIVKVIELTQKINTIERDINTLKTIFSGWSPISQDGGAALKSAAAAWIAQMITETNKSDIENTDIKH